jgi:hypothetical protein
MTTKQRLDLIINALGLSGRAFEKACGLANGSYSSIGNGVGADKLKKILTQFPQISAEWLLTGYGEMFKTSETAGKSHESPTGKSHVQSEETNYVKILFKMADLVSVQQRDISRLISELERNGQRADRVLCLIEGGMNVSPAGDTGNQLRGQ